jgi:hypothetical protein
MTKEASEAYQAAKWQALGDYEADKGLEKVSKKSILSLLAVVLISLSLFAACTCGTTTPTTTTPTPEALEWDPDHVMAYYVESTHDVSLLAYSHIQEDVTCIDCYDITVLRQLYQQCDLAANKLEETKMSELSKELCLICHMSYSELVELTKDSTVFSEGTNAYIHLGETEFIHWGVTELWKQCSSCHKICKESLPVHTSAIGVITKAAALSL